MSLIRTAVQAAPFLALVILVSGCAIERRVDEPMQEPSDADQETQVSGEQQVSLQIDEGPQGQVLAFIPVYINDQGPYNFALDTGASRSTLDQELAQQLNLPAQGPAGPATGVGGTAQAQLVSVESWRLGENVSLGSGTLAAINIPETDRGYGIQGLLGSDVLSTFGTIAINYEEGVLVIRPRTQPAPTPTPP